MEQFTNQDVVLKHRLPTRIFHVFLILGFMPAAITGLMLATRFLWPGEIMHRVMQIHIVAAIILSITCAVFLFLQPNRIAAFWNEIFAWSKRDLIWFKLCGGYPQKILFRREVEVPAMGKYNSGQKVLGILVFFGVIILITSGFILYFALPLVPKAIAFGADKVHLVVGVVLTLAIVFLHIPLSLYNFREAKCMFGNGTIPVEEVMKHNKLWVENKLEACKVKTYAGKVEDAASHYCK